MNYISKLQCATLQGYGHEVTNSRLRAPFFLFFSRAIMDDLSSLDWSASTSSSTNAASKQPPMNPMGSLYPTLRATPSPFASGRNTPLSVQASGAPLNTSQLPKSAQDSFSSLDVFGATKNNATLSLREHQARQEAEKRKTEEARRQQAQAQFGDGQFLDVMASGRSRNASPALRPPGSGTLASANANGRQVDSDDDLFAAFNADTKVDKSSFYPPPSSGKSSPAKAPGVNLRGTSMLSHTAPSSNSGLVEDDDDPFGLNQMKSMKAPAPPTQTLAADEEEDDLLGDLAKPVHQVRRKPQEGPKFAMEPEPGKPIEDWSSDSDVEEPISPNNAFDKAVAQLVDYGFTPENARRGLTESGAGLNVQAAANWLLDDAHRQAKEKSKARQSTADLHAADRTSCSRSRTASPAWMQDDSSNDGLSRRDNRSPPDGDLAKTAAAMGTNLLKTANSLWKTGQKRVQKAVADLHQPDGGEPSQPKWMRSAQQDLAANPSRKAADVTEEAMMLDSGMRPGRRQEPGPAKPHSNGAPSFHDQMPPRSSASSSRASPVPRWQQPPPLIKPDARSRISKLAVEEQSAQVYVSPARRRKATSQPQPEESLQSAPEGDLLFNSRAPPKADPWLPSLAAQPPVNRGPASQSSALRPPAPARPPRQIPHVSAIALQSSTQHRVAGTAHFKRGDYAAAHASYTSSFAAIPPEHPVAIVLLCNRALTALKTGEPRQAVDDADHALRLIGPGKGEGEHVEIQGDGNTVDKRDMGELYGKALTRKAEALEQMEKWAEAGAVWQQAIEAGAGGATATAGRQRCQKALAPKPARRPAAAAAAAKPRPRPVAGATAQKSSEAVQRLRQANAAADLEGKERFVLADKVDARIAAWRDGKRDNLRALLGSLDNVLWEGSGWKKVGLHELVVVNKVKIIYMKAIAKTHPDKVSPSLCTPSPSSRVLC